MTITIHVLITMRIRVRVCLQHLGAVVSVVPQLVKVPYTVTFVNSYFLDVKKTSST